MRVAAMRIVVGKHILQDIFKEGSFFWLLCLDHKENAALVVETVAKILEEWEPPQLEDLTDALISGWIDQLKFKCIPALYVAFQAPRLVSDGF